MNYNWSIIELPGGIRMERFLPEERKSGSPILFAHGNFCGSWCWHNLLKFFSSKGIPCYAVNYRGHWISSGHEGLGAVTVGDYITDVKECLKFIGEEPVLIGHSMGGIVSQKTAEQNPLKGLVLLDSAPCREITENYFCPDPEVNNTIMSAFKFLPDGTVRMECDEESTKKILFEKDKVSRESLLQTMAYLGRESADALKNHAFVDVNSNKVKCPVYVMGRKGMGNKEKPDLWNTLADYYDAEERYISGDISHAMFLEEDWEKHALLIEKWLF